jgi:glutamine phosphoribosylpyrophosphate amidotransferase
MNAIYGSNNKEKFLHLQKLNDGRCKVNHGMVLIKNESFDIYKVHSDAKDFKFPKRKKYHTLLGISQKKTKNFIPNEMEPFIFNQWVVACYGKILNQNEIIEEFVEQDTIVLNNAGFVLGQLLEKTSAYSDNDVDVIANGLSLVEGDYAMWLHNAESGNSFLAKCGIDLYADVYENTFSTNQFYGSDNLQDGEVYQLTREGITHVSIFDCNQ